MTTTIIYNRRSNTFDVTVTPDASTALVDVLAKATYNDMLNITDPKPGMVVLVLDASKDVKAATHSSFYVYAKIVETDNTSNYAWHALNIVNPSRTNLPSNVRIATPDGTGDGLYWTSPSNLKALIEGFDGGRYDEIWCLGDLYSTDDLPPIPSDLRIYGGFAGTESALSERELTDAGYPTTATVFSTSVDAPVLQVGSRVNPSNNVIVDGLIFTDHDLITAGHPGSVISAYGQTARSIHITRCTFSDNSQPESAVVGGTVGGFEFDVDTCDFHQNIGVTGAAIYGEYNVTVSNTICHSNYSSDTGGAIQVSVGGVLANCDIHNNTAMNNGGGIYGMFSAITNTTIVNNLVAVNGSNVGGGMSLTTPATVVNTVIAGNMADTVASEYNVLPSTLFVNCISTRLTSEGRNNLRIPNMISAGLVSISPFAGAPCTNRIWSEGRIAELSSVDFSPNGYYVGLKSGVQAYDGVAVPPTDIRGIARGLTPDIGAYQFTTRYANPVITVNGLLANRNGEIEGSYKPFSRTVGSTIIIDPKNSLYVATIDGDSTILFNLDAVNLSVMASFDLMVIVPIDGIKIGVSADYVISSPVDMTTAGKYFYNVVIMSGVPHLYYMGKSN